MREYVISHEARSEDKLLGLVVTRQLQVGKVRSNEGNVQHFGKIEERELVLHRSVFSLCFWRPVHQ